MIFPPVHSQWDKAHGRLETRTLQITDALNSHLDFPSCGQVFRLTRERLHLSSGQRDVEVVFGVTSLTPQEAAPERLLHLNRGHWSIENRSHYVRDMAYDEDRQQIRRKNGPRVMATLRNFAISVLRLAGYQNITAALRRMAADRRLALRLLGLRC
jgi:hypothetical protein